MVIDFLNSEFVDINGEKAVYFKDLRLIRDEIDRTLVEIGPKRFFSDPTQKVKKIRESMAALFLLLAIKRDLGQNWMFMQPEDDPPDFILMRFGEEYSSGFNLVKFESVEIPGHFKDFEEMMIEIQKKLGQKEAYKNHSLLIFVNNENSRKWLPLLHTRLNSFDPFKEVWTVNLLQNKDFFIAVVNRIRPLPIKHIETPISADDLDWTETLPAFMEEIEVDGRKFMRPRDDFVQGSVKEMRKELLRRSQEQKQYRKLP